MAGSVRPGSQAKMRPIIGLTVSYRFAEDMCCVRGTYVRAIAQAGGVPVCLAPFCQREHVEEILRVVDGLLFSGGADVDPAWFGEEPAANLGPVDPVRDEFEMILARRAIELGAPVLGVCRGAQVLNVAAGGTLYQDINRQVAGACKHWQDAPRWHPTHAVLVKEGSLLAGLIGGGKHRVNSFHHQAVREPGECFRVCATSGDGVVEAIEHGEGRFVLGLQWHPEDMFGRDAAATAVFLKFIEAARGANR